MHDQDERRVMVGEFCDIFAVEEEVAVHHLTRNEWNLEAAVRDFLVNQEWDNDAVLNRDDPIDHSPSNAGVNLQQVANTFYLHLSNSLILRLLWNLVYIPYCFAMDLLRGLVATVWSVLSLPFQRMPPAIADVESFAAHFDRTYGPQHPTFYRGSYLNALADVKRELSYLIVYLHNGYHEDTDNFCRNIICHPDFDAFVRRVGLFFAVDISSGEGSRVSAVMHNTGYPFLAVVCYRDRRMSIVFRQEATCSIQELLDRLTRTVEVNNQYLRLTRAERQNTEMNQMLRQQQEAAYEEALQRDRESEKRVNDEAKKKEELEAKERAAKDKEAEESRALTDRRRECAESLPAEATGDQAVRVRFKFPSGDAFERHFLPSDSITTLRDFVFSKACCPKHFSIYVGYPRRLIYNSQGDQDRATETVGNFCTGKAEAVLVVDNDA